MGSYFQESAKAKHSHEPKTKNGSRGNLKWRKEMHEDRIQENESRKKRTTKPTTNSSSRRIDENVTEQSEERFNLEIYSSCSTYKTNENAFAETAKPKTSCFSLSNRAHCKFFPPHTKIKRNVFLVLAKKARRTSSSEGKKYQINRWRNRKMYWIIFKLCGSPATSSYLNTGFFAVPLNVERNFTRNNT